MTTITLEVPDELALRLMPVRDLLPELLIMALDLLPAEASTSRSGANMTHLAFKEAIDFLANSPTHEQVITFKLSTHAQERLDDLLDTNREGSLTAKEIAELNTYRQINHVLLLLKARSRRR